MTKSRCLGWIAAALCFSLTSLPGRHFNAEAALPLRLRSSNLPVAPNTAMAVPLPVPPPAQTAPPSLPMMPLPAPLPTDSYPRFGQALSPEVIRRVIWVHLNQIKYCYQQALFKQPTLAGRLLVNFQINPQGQVLELSVRETTLASDELIACVSEAMRNWEFPPTPTYDGIIEINYPFLLRPRVSEASPGIQISDAELERIGVYRDPEPPAVDIVF
jgi:hypothetical protein